MSENHLLEQAIDQLPTGFALIDPDRRFRIVNQRYIDLLELPEGLVAPGTAVQEEVRFQVERGDFGEGDQQAFIAGAMARLSRVEQQIFERELPSGRSLQYRVSPMPDGGLVQIVVDITDLKRAETQARLQASITTNTLETIDQGIVVVDDRLRTVAVNALFAQMFDLPLDMLRAQPDYEAVLHIGFKILQIEDAVLLERALANIHRRDAFSFVQQLPDGRVLEVHHLPRADGWFVRTFSDVTERIRSEKRFQALLEAAPDAMVIANADGAIVEINKQTERLFGYEGSELIGKPVEILIPPRLRKTHPAHRNGYFANPGVRPMSVGLDLFGLRKSGEEFPIDVSLSPIETDEGLLVSAAVRDITARKQAERALQTKSSQLQSALASMQEGLFMLDADLNYVLYNEQYKTLMGLPNELVQVGRNIRVTLEYYARQGMYGSGDPQRQVEDRLRAYREAESRRILPGVDGRVLSLHRSRTPDGGTVTVISDITEIKAAEQALADKSAQLQIALDNMQEGLIVLDAEQNFVLHNERYKSLMAVPDALVQPGRTVRDVLRLFAERGQYDSADGSIDAMVARRVDAVKQAESGLRMRGAGDSTVELRRSPTPDGGTVTVLVDVTEQQRLEQSLRAARDQAESALAELKRAQAELVHSEKMASLGQLTAGIAHEIKNPLNFVNNFADTSVGMLEDLATIIEPALTSLDEDGREEAQELLNDLREDLTSIAGHGRRADRIMRSMLLQARDNSGERAMTDLNALVEEALKLAYHSERARHSDFNIEIATDYDTGIGELSLLGPELTRVLVNLFENGFYAVRTRAKQGERDGYEPAVAVSTRAAGADAVEIRIRDNGTGIPAEVVERIYEPFYTTKPPGDGTGLGLPLCYDIVVNAHKGRMEVQTEEGAFTEFLIRLPREAQGAIS